MPAAANPMIAPSLLRRRRLLIVGCGDVGLRVLRLLRGRWRLLAVTSDPARMPELRAAGARPLLADLDDAPTLRRLAGLAGSVLHLAPPPGSGHADSRTAALVHALARGARGRRLVYASTTGVYGDAAGARFDETRIPRPATERARRRLDAERRLRAWGRRRGATVTILRVPGIYALDRAVGDPRRRVRAGAPVLRAEDDVYTNHIHADDLARACVAALCRGRPQRVVHVCDDSERKMGDHYDLVARLAGLVAPPRLARVDAQLRLSAATLSFMSESRRLDNRRLKRELRVVLRYPRVETAFSADAATRTADARASG